MKVQHKVGLLYYRITESLYPQEIAIQQLFCKPTVSGPTETEPQPKQWPTPSLGPGAHSQELGKSF